MPGIKVTPFDRNTAQPLGGGTGGGSTGQPTGGDLDGTLPAPTVTGLQGTPVGTSVPTTGQVLTFDGTSWSPATPGASSSPLTTKGDVYGYSTVNARIPVGTNGQVLTADSTQTLGLKWAAASSSAIATGTSNPGSPATNDLFFRTDLGFLIYYDGTRWLTIAEYALHLAQLDALEGTTTAPQPYGAVDRLYGSYVTRLETTTFQSTGTGANYVTYQLTSRSPALSAHNLGSSFNTSADTAANMVGHEVAAINSVVTSGDTQYRVTGTKTGSPTGLYCLATVYYRLIVT